MKYRKKPVVIEAMQWDGSEESTAAIAEFAKGEGFALLRPKYGDDRGPKMLEIPTLEGDMRAQVGDWIIKGVKSEFYPCKPDIFEATYEEVDNGTA